MKKPATKPKRGRPPLYGEKLVLTNFRLPARLIEDLEACFHALGRRSVSDLVREALREFLDKHARAIHAYRRFRKNQNGTVPDSERR